MKDCEPDEEVFDDSVGCATDNILLLVLSGVVGLFATVVAYVWMQRRYRHR
jgi:hypothetical protein